MTKTLHTLSCPALGAGFVLAPVVAGALLTLTTSTQAAFLTPTASDYLLIGRGSSSDGVAVQVGSSNSLGRLYTVPASSDPDVDDNPPWPLPAGATPPTGNVITNDGNVAVTNTNGTYNFQDIDIWADIGVRAPSGVTTSARDGWSNSTLTNGTFADDAAGMATIEAELDAAKTAIAGLTGTGGWTVSGDGFKNGSNQWQINSGTVDSNTTITLDQGLNVIVIDTNDNDFSLNNAGLVVDGPEGSSVIFLLENEDQANFLYTDASVTYGQSGIGPDAILFATLDGGNDSNFNLSKVIVNGVSFWDLSEDGGEITMNNVQGCGQWIGDHLNFNDVQLARCAYAVPEPTSLALLALGGLLVSRRRRG